MTRQLIVYLMFLLPVPVFAHGDEDHGANAAPAAMSSVAPRAEAQTELFELLVTPHDGQLTIYLDGYADNQPVADAKVEIESGNWKAVASAVAHGTYRVAAPQFAKPGNYPLVFTVTAGDEADLIETTLTVTAATAPAVTGSRFPAWGWFAGTLLVATFAVAVLLKRRQSKRQGK